MIQTLKRNYINFRGWSTKRKIIVIESDDWGAVRMPSRKVYDDFLKRGITVDKHYFAKNDCLESNEDIELLFGVLSSFKDKNGFHPVITANSVVANPDFNRIKDNNKQMYFYENIKETYKSYPAHDKVFDLWLNYGINQHLLWPQFHGREHINVSNWMRAINSNLEIEDFAFDNRVILGMKTTDALRQSYNYMAAFQYRNDDEKLLIESITEDGLQIFKDLFGFSSKSFIASCGIQGEHLDRVLSKNGVLFHQNGHQFRPLTDGTIKADQKLWGQRNKHGQVYWRRNATFEPSKLPSFDWVDSCLAEINCAFRWGKPAVINSHRVNFSGGIFKENRDNTLRLLTLLLKRVINRWPNIEFFTSEELGSVLNEKS